MVRAAAIAIALTIATVIARGAPAHAATITGATIERQGAVVELQFAVHGRGLGWHLSAHGQQLWIDLEHVRMLIPARPLGGREQNPITSVESIDDGAGTARIVVEVTGRTDYAIGRFAHRLILRLAPAGAAPDLAALLLRRMEHVRAPGAGSPPAVEARNRVAAAYPNSLRRAAPAKTPPAAAADAAETARGTRPLVVIDAGHGGHDPGTEAAGEVAEKDLALAIAMRVARALVARGVDARLTRASDLFLTLAERTQMANRAGADLFVSIHLNSSPDAAASGIETYYLNNTTDRATIRLARMENGVSGGYGAEGEPNLNYILTDMRQQYKANESASLARMIEAETVADIDASMGLKVNELGAMQGPFYVLVGALMPSVLIECGFLSDPDEARLLESTQYQQALADGVARAVVHYFNADAAVGNL
ncbi:MAG TPA: N-acetylmuramoyl-L-alanine amidase [Candidatus Binataceae bacterium]|nr:N-acetylmuramoyl-L-alanine amidase [Candidatus Binataceae bacterium]